MIIYKWCVNWSVFSPPSLLNTIVYMFLSPGNLEKSGILYEGQVHFYFIIFIFIIIYYYFIILLFYYFIILLFYYFIILLFILLYITRLKFLFFIFKILITTNFL